MVDANHLLKLLPTSTLDAYKMLEHIDMLSMVHSAAALNRYTPVKATALAPLAMAAVSTKSLLLLDP
jgi:hypothetical protein